MPRTNPPPRGYVSVTGVIREGKKNGLEIGLNTLKWRIDHGQILAIRDPDDCRRRRLIPSMEIPNVIAHFSELYESRNGKYCSLSKLATDLGMKKRSLHPRAKEIGIETFKIGNRRMMTKKQYFKWRFLLSRKQEKKKKYISTGYLGRYYGVSHYLVLHYVKIGRIPAERFDRGYMISRKDFEENKEEWRMRCGFPGNGKGEKV